MLLFNYCDLHVSQSKKFDSFCHFVFGVIVFKLNSGWHGATLIVECLWLCLLFPTETGCYRIPYREETNSWIVKVWQQGSKALFSYVPLILRGIGCNVDRSQPHCWKKKKKWRPLWCCHGNKHCAFNDSLCTHLFGWSFAAIIFNLHCTDSVLNKLWGLHVFHSWFSNGRHIVTRLFTYDN